MLCQGLAIQHRGDYVLEVLRTVVALVVAVVAMWVSRWAFVSQVSPAAAPVALLPICRVLFLSQLSAALISMRHVVVVSCVSAAEMSAVIHGSLRSDCDQVAVDHSF